jgi:hypothetical protein
MNDEKAADVPADYAAKATDAVTDQEEVIRRFKDIQVMSRPLMQLEAKRLARKLGKDHPRTLELKARLERHLDVVDKLEVGRQISKIVPPKAGKDKVLIHGRVTDDKLRGVRDLSVTFTDAKGTRYVEAIACVSDESGYYSLVLDEEKVEELKSAGRGKVYVSVNDSEGKTIYRNPDAVAFTPGITISRDLILRLPRTPVQRDVTTPTKKRPPSEGSSAKKVADGVENIAGIGVAKAEKLKKAGIRDMKTFLETADKKLVGILGKVDITKMKEDCRSKLKKSK